jgi:ribosomal protein S19
MIHESLIGSAVLVFDDVNKILFRVTHEKVGFKFSDFDCNDKLNQKEDKKIENKEAKRRDNPFTDDFVEGLTRGMIDQDSIIRNSFLGKTVKFKNNGVITDCFVTPDKIGHRFGDFTYNNELVQKINKKIDQKLHAKEKTSTLKKNKKRIKFPQDPLVDIKDYKKVFKRGV